MEQMGVDEVIGGFLTDHHEIRSGDVVRSNELIHARVEPELAFRVGRPVVLGEGGRDLRECIDGVAPDPGSRECLLE